MMSKLAQRDKYVVFKDTEDFMTPSFYAENIEEALRMQWSLEMVEENDADYKWRVAEILKETGVEGWLIRLMRKIIRVLDGG